MESMRGFKISLAAVRVNAGLTQVELARRLDVDKTTIINWEKGKTSPKSTQLKELCRICEAPMSMILLPDAPLKAETAKA